MNAPTPAQAAPLHRWVGGKTNLLPVLEQALPATFQRYFAPFTGGGALFWHLANQGRITRAVLADATPQVVATLQSVRNYPDFVVVALQGLRDAWAEQVTPEDRAAAWGRMREHLATVPNTSLLGMVGLDAATFLAHQQLCFNGLWRVNGQGRPNVALGADSDGNPLSITVDEALIHACSRALQAATVHHHVAFMGDLFRKSWTLPEPTEGDLVYLDPPYLPMGPTADFTAYTAEGFGPNNHAQLAAWALRARLQGAHVVISNSDTPLTRHIFDLDGDAPHWEVIETTRSGSVSCKGDGRGRVGELVMWGGAA